MPILEDAITIAAGYHAGQVDKSGEPYILHPLRVMLSLDSELARVLGVLHDVCEDCDIDPEEVAIQLDPECQWDYHLEFVDTLHLLTRKDEDTYFEYIAKISKNPLASTVKYADLIDNSSLNRLMKIKDIDVRTGLWRRYDKAKLILRGESEKRGVYL